MVEGAWDWWRSQGLDEGVRRDASVRDRCEALVFFRTVMRFE
jgi:hypothetical protein